ncbi:MAG: hypothetical protein QY317_16480 [Candidatus Jettenia caeni]|nr:MAG: hypothetical protein QY317_16480 [Candidatus Jettenia caeni]
MILDIANFIRELPKKRLIATLSLAGATSQRINSEKNDLIQANIEIGMDVLHPIDNKHKKGAKLCRLF